MEFLDPNFSSSVLQTQRVWTYSYTNHIRWKCSDAGLRISQWSRNNLRDGVNIHNIKSNSVKKPDSDEKEEMEVCEWEVKYEDLVDDDDDGKFYRENVASLTLKKANDDQ